MIFLILTILCTINIYSLDNHIADMRTDLYYKGAVPPMSEISNIYDAVMEQDSVKLKADFGVVLSELRLYTALSNDITTDMLRDLFKLSKKHLKKQKSPDNYLSMGEFAFILTRADRRKKVSYYIDSRMFFRQVLFKDRKNIDARLGMGKLMAVDIMGMRHREYNHTMSRALKYLDDAEIANIDKNDIHRDIKAANIYYLRALLNMRILQTENARHDIQKAMTFSNNKNSIVFNYMYDTYRGIW